MIQYLKIEKCDYRNIINNCNFTHKITFLGNSSPIAYAERINGAFHLYDRDFVKTKLIGNTMKDAKKLIADNRSIFKI